jgi:hypothetical protein
MSTPSSASNHTAGLAAIAHSYFTALSDGGFDRVPWSADVVLRTPLRPDAPLRGRSSVEAFFQPLVGQLGHIQILETYFNDAGDTVLVEASVGPLHVMDKFVFRDGQIVEQENVFDPRPVLDAPSPGGISADERALLVEMLQASRERMKELIKAAPANRWHEKPAGGGWSAAECAEHLVLSEDALLGLIRGQILKSPANPTMAVDLRGKDAVIVQAMQDRSQKATTFDFLEPRGTWPDQDSVLNAFLARRGETLEYCRDTRDPLHHHAAPLGQLGLLDGYQWLLLIASHTDRHIAQMESALGSVPTA